MWILLVSVVVIALVATLWDRFRSDDAIKEWMLRIPHLDGLCRDYLDYVKQMSAGQHDIETIHYLDSQRQVTHNQILERLGLDRAENFDMIAFCERYLNQS